MRIFKPNIKRLQARQDFAALVECLNDKNESIRQKASMALVEMGKPAIESLISTLSKGSEQTKKYVFEILGEIGDPSAVERIIAGLNDMGAGIPIVAINTLNKLDPNWRDRESVQKLVYSILEMIGDFEDDDELDYRDLIYDDLIRIGKPVIGPMILHIPSISLTLMDEYFETLEAIDPLWTDSQEAREKIPNLIEMLSNQSLNRIAIIYLLGMIKDPQAIPPLMDILNTKGGISYPMRVKDGRAPSYTYIYISYTTMALQALENIDSKLLQDPQVLELIPSLIDQLYSEYPLVIRDAIVALEKIKDPRSIRPLIGLLDNESEFVKLNAYSALKKVTGEDFGINVLKWQKWLDQTA